MQRKNSEANSWERLLEGIKNGLEVRLCAEAA